MSASDESIFAGCGRAAQLSEAYLRGRESVASRAASLCGSEVTRAYSDLTDGLVARIHQIAEEEAGTRQGRCDLVICALGGYGRREMAPYSDVDVSFIVGAEEDDEIDRIVKRAFRLLMDVLEASGISVGYSYRRADEVDNLPLDTQTALLDARRITGSRALYSAFSMSLRKAIAPAIFVAGHMNARDDSGTPFTVEPDLKEGSGGLRDLHRMRWIAQVALGSESESVWDGLRARGILCDKVIAQMHDAAEFITRVRNALHTLSGRQMDTIVVARHEQVADYLGIATGQEMIARYYAHAHLMRRVYHRVSSACIRVDLEVEPGIVAREGRIHILDVDLPRRDPSAILRAIRHAQTLNLEVAPGSGDLLTESVAGYQPTAEASQLFLDILSGVGAGKALRLMMDLGILQGIVRQFGELMYLIPGDAVHRFTVGEHSLRAVEYIESLLGESDAGATANGGYFADVLSRVQHFEVLFLATLLHDVGKLDSSRDHSKTGAFRAAKLARALGMPVEACSKVEFLVRHHLRMAETARLRDLHQPKTIRDFVAVVRDPHLLDMLLLLTVADYAALGAHNWSRVQLRFLLELHERAWALMRSPDASGPDIVRHRARVGRELRLANLPADLVDEHCSSMPAAYLLNTPPEELAVHIGHVRTVREGSPVVEARDDRGGEFSVLTAVAPDQPGLLSRIAGVMHALSVDIHAAQGFTRSSTDEIAIDTLYIDFEGRQLAETKKWQVEAELTAVLSGKSSVDELLHRFGKRRLESADGATVTALDNLSDHATVIEVRATDRLGLLHYLTGRISSAGCDIHSARVATWGHEARDVFYVTDRQGEKLRPEHIGLLQAALQNTTHTEGI